MAAAATAKQILYHPPLALLPKRKNTTPITTTTHNHPHHPPRGAPTLTVTIPFSFSTRLSRLDARRGLQSASSSSIHRAGSRPRPAPMKSTTTPRTTSLPRLGLSHQGGPPQATPRSRFSHHQQTSSGGPSNQTSRSTTTPYSGSEARRTSSGYGAEEASLEENGEAEEGVEEVAVHHQDDAEGYEVEDWVDREVVLSPEEERERKLNKEKCQRWLQGLPNRFSSMHVVQHVVYNGGNK